ncbi:hypothetical protein C5167_027273 [Papaver somniferum]|nr:hypothetical protein C5167_027273 [Papaver somniferum]
MDFVILSAKEKISDGELDKLIYLTRWNFLYQATNPLSRKKKNSLSKSHNFNQKETTPDSER